MAKTAIDIKLVLLGFAGIALVVYLASTGAFQMAAAPGVPGAPSAEGPGYQATLTFDTWNVYEGHAGTNQVNAILLTNQNTKQAAEFAVDASPDTLGTLPTTFGGYLLVGNDNYVSGTDQGSEIYLTKQPVSWVNSGDPYGGVVRYYNESSITWYGYDAGTLETTLNVSIGSGASYTRAELEIEAGDNACIGNPDFRKVALAVNCTDIATLSKFDWIKPKSGWYSGTDTLPEFLSGKGYFGTIYILNSDAYICDYGTYRFPIEIQAKAGSDPSSGNICYAHLLDWGYAFSDNNVLTTGWEDKSDLTTDKDIGIDTIANQKAIAFS